MSKTPTLESFEKEYASLVPSAERLRDGLTQHIKTQLAVEGIELAFPIESRVKTWQSVKVKLASGDIDVRKVKRIQDLIGLRLVVLFTRDLESVCELIKRLLTVKRQADHAANLKPKEFGYQSIHHVVELPAELQTLPQFEGCSGLLVEIQVRTLAQHIWAAASHKLQYKNEDSVADSIKRPLYRAAALLEVVDLEFERVLIERTNYRDLAETEPLDTALNVDNLDALLKQYFPEDWIEDEPLSDLLEELQYFSVDTRRKLITLLNSHMVNEKHAKDFDPHAPLEQSDDHYFQGRYVPAVLIDAMLSEDFPDIFERFQYEQMRKAFKDFLPRPDRSEE